MSDRRDGTADAVHMQVLDPRQNIKFTFHHIDSNNVYNVENDNELVMK